VKKLFVQITDQTATGGQRVGLHAFMNKIFNELVITGARNAHRSYTINVEAFWVKLFEITFYIIKLYITIKTTNSKSKQSQLGEGGERDTLYYQNCQYWQHFNAFNPLDPKTAKFGHYITSIFPKTAISSHLLDNISRSMPGQSVNETFYMYFNRISGGRQSQLFSEFMVILHMVPYNILVTTGESFQGNILKKFRI
jgi:hypothetical protein